MKTLKLKIKEIDTFLFSAIEGLENQKMTLVSWLLTFLTLVFLRNFFETFSSKDNLFLAENWSVFFGHYVGFFLFWILTIILVIYLLTREKIEKITKVAIFGMFFSLIVSVFEMVFSFFRFESIRNKYELILITDFNNLIKIFIEYTGWGVGSFFKNDAMFNGNIFILVSIMKVVFLLLIIIFGMYLFRKTKSLFLLIIYSLFIFVIQFFGQLYFYEKGISDHSFFSSSHFLENFGPNVIGSFAAAVCAVYVFLKTNNMFKTFFVFVFFYVFGFFAAYFPSIFVFLLKLPSVSTSFYGVSNINPDFSWNRIFSSVYFILIFIFANFWFLIYNKEKFLAIWRNIRPLRFIHNLALLGFGFAISVLLAPGPYGVGVLPKNLNFFDALILITASLALLFFWLSAVSYDDVSDEKIDKISNPRRPICQNDFSKEEFNRLSSVFRWTSYLFAILVGYGFLLFIFLRSLMVYIYSAPPFRLKRFPIIATFFLALSALFTVLAGFVLSPQYTVLDFPKKLILFILVVFTFGFMTKDIKDYKGDKIDGVYTIPVIFGERNGKIIIGFLAVIILFLPVIFFFNFWKFLVLPSIVFGALSFWLINKRNYNEFPLFLVYFFNGIIFFAFYFLAR